MNWIVEVSEGFRNTHDEDILLMLLGHLRVFRVCFLHVLGHRQTYMHATYEEMI
jgi:hypothetical protein